MLILTSPRAYQLPRIERKKKDGNSFFAFFLEKGNICRQARSEEQASFIEGPRGLKQEPGLAGRGRRGEGRGEDGGRALQSCPSPRLAFPGTTEGALWGSPRRVDFCGDAGWGGNARSLHLTAPSCLNGPRGKVGPEPGKEFPPERLQDARRRKGRRRPRHWASGKAASRRKGSV